MNIDWAQLITKEMKQAAAQAALLAGAKSELARRNGAAAALILRIQDRIDTLGYGIAIGEATAEDEAEQSALIVSLKAWKAYKFGLGKVAAQSTWPTAPVWPSEPAVPVMVTDSEISTVETI
jgi:type IV secretory pathway TrbD component